MPERQVVFNRIGRFLLITLIETGSLFVIIWLLERAGILGIYVTFVDYYFIYPYETGGFFFLFIAIANIIGVTVDYFIFVRPKTKGKNACCSDLSCAGEGLPVCNE